MLVVEIDKISNHVNAQKHINANIHAHVFMYIYEYNAQEH